LKESLSIEKKSLKLSKKERDRQEKLFKKDTIPASKFESEVRNYNSQLLKVQSLKNSLNLVPSSRKQLMASLALNQANLANAKRDLENTVIKAPYNCRFTAVSIEAAQYVQKGQVLITADGTGVTEVAAQIPMDKVFSLFSGNATEMTLSAFEFSKMREILGLSVIVRVNSGRFDAEWQGRFSRPDASIDQKTRTAGIIVAVDNPYEKIIPGKRPPLVRNMYCEVEISGRPLPDSIVIPRSSVHQGIVYIVNQENRLVRRKVIIGIPQSGFHVIKEGLEPGDRVIVSDIIPAIEGMLLNPQEDIAALARLEADATGSAKVK
jgi:RND family efflux transporter MFP subunit